MRFDLEELAAPIENLKSELHDAYQALDDEWEAIDRKVRSLAIPCRVTLPLQPWGNMTERSLEWRKFKKTWRFCVVVKRPPGPHEKKKAKAENREPAEFVDVCPLEQWTAQERMNLLQHVPKFFEQATSDTKAFIRRASRAKAAC